MTKTEQSETPIMKDAFPIVGIGASAGGLEALQNFIGAIPNDSGMAYVIVQHLSTDQPSLMDKLLRAHSVIPVNRITDGAPVEPDQVFVIPPGTFLEIVEGRFKLIEHPREEGVRTPIDRFFTSLSSAAGRMAFSVILSGTGSDGTVGVRSVKMMGGVVLVQESNSARFPGMPNSAAATGLVDFVLRARDMPAKILEIARHRESLDDQIGQKNLQDQIDSQLTTILECLETDGAHSFSGYKPGTLVRRVARRMSLLRQSSVAGYLATLTENPEERGLLMQDFLIGVTQFFRDPENYKAFGTQVLRPLLDLDQPSFRIWVPGCSTGEEVYSIAILIQELREETGDRRHWNIFGTDIDFEALRYARAGRFPEASLAPVDGERRERFFTPDGTYLQVDSRLREMCVFAPHDLLQDPPFSRLDLISCRNVMIYLNSDSQEAVFPRFHYALNPGGFLWLGPSETLGRSTRFFRALDRTAKLFQRDDAEEPGYSALSHPSAQRDRSRDVRGSVEPPMAPSTNPGEDIEKTSETVFLTRLANPFATINRQNEVVFLSEAMTHFVRPARGAPSNTLEDYLTQELRLPVQSAVDETRDTGLEAEVRNVVVQGRDASRIFDIRTAPVGAGSDHVVVALIETRHADIEKEVGQAGVLREESYQQELLMTRKRLTSMEREYQSSEEKLRSANEELLSMNEELQSSNEELETSREELQSINEELETINAELTENNRQLTRANSDLKNLFESTDIATLFMDQVDCVRLFTPEVARLFGVQERDIGRPIHDLATNIDYSNLQADAAEVRETLQPINREVRIKGSHETFAMRIRPYRTIDNRLDGVVITFVDITDRKLNEKRLEENARALSEQYAELETLYDTAPIGLSLVDLDLRYLRINETLAGINGLTVDEHIGAFQKDLLPEAHDQLADLQQRVIETGQPMIGLAVQTETPAQPGRVREFIVDFYPVKNGGEVIAIGSCVREITKERELERELVESAVRQRAAVAAAGLGVFEWHVDDDKAVWENERMFEIFGRDPAMGALTFKEFSEDVIHPDDLERFSTEMQRAKTHGRLETVVRVRRKADHALRHLAYSGTFLSDPQGKPERMFGVIADVTEQRRAQEREEGHRRRLKRLQDSLSSFVGLLDPDGTLIEVNATALARGGIMREDVIGKKFWDCWWWSFSADSQDRLRDAVGRAAQGETLRYNVPVRMAKGERLIVDFQLVPSFDDDGRVTEIVPSAVDVTDRVQAEERKDLLLAELEHRVKNTLATVQAVARITARMAVSKEDMAVSLIGRIAAMARTHEALTASDWQGQTLRALVEAEVSSYVGSDNRRFSFIGDDIQLEPRRVLSIALAIHELATNAAKHGAFSNGEGRVEVRATCDGSDFTRLEWREMDGPPVVPPKREGFGTFLIQQMLKKELGAEIRVSYHETGLICVIER